MSRHVEKSLLEIDFASLTRGPFTPSPAASEDQVLYYLMLVRFSDGNERGGYGDVSGRQVETGSMPLYRPDELARARAALDLIFLGHFNRSEPGIFEPLRGTLLGNRDHYMHLADLNAYLRADDALTNLYARPDEWSRKAILNVANSGKFSSDRTITEYAAEIWNAKPCPVQE